MSTWGTRSRGDRVALESAWGRDAARLLAALKRGGASGVSVAEMRERGIEAPAQAIYTLQLAGYGIDRTPTPTDGGAPVYRLSRGPRAAPIKPERIEIEQEDEDEDAVLALRRSRRTIR
jgi:hypothetical protein